MKRRTTITTEMERKMRELRAQGKSAKEIAAVIGVSATAVKNHTAGIIVPAEEKQARVEAVRRMYAEGKTYAQIEKRNRGIGGDHSQLYPRYAEKKN